MGAGSFLFKQKTAYDISECNWCSDVCSSGLVALTSGRVDIVVTDQPTRPEERRVGTESPRLCRSWWSPYH